MVGQVCDNGCFTIPGKYLDPVCPKIVDRWLKSDWRMEDELAEIARKKEEIADAKAFVEAVAKQK